jgi:hypothetical protein
MHDRLLLVHSTHWGRPPSHRTFFCRHGVQVLQRVPPGEVRPMRFSRGRFVTFEFVISAVRSRQRGACAESTVGEIGREVKVREKCRDVGCGVEQRRKSPVEVLVAGTLQSLTDGLVMNRRRKEEPRRRLPSASPKNEQSLAGGHRTTRRFQRWGFLGADPLKFHSCSIFIERPPLKFRAVATKVRCDC